MDPARSEFRYVVATKILTPSLYPGSGSADELARLTVNGFFQASVMIASRYSLNRKMRATKPPLSWLCGSRKDCQKAVFSLFQSHRFTRGARQVAGHSDVLGTRR